MPSGTLAVFVRCLVGGRYARLIRRATASTAAPTDEPVTDVSGAGSACHGQIPRAPVPAPAPVPRVAQRRGIPHVAVAVGPPGWLQEVAVGVRELDDSLRPTDEQLEAHERLLTRLRALVSPLGGVLCCYGSAVTGLRTCSSDLDVTWLLPQEGDTPEAARNWAIRQLRLLLEEAADCCASDVAPSAANAIIVRLRGSELADCGPRLRPDAERARLVYTSQRHGAPPVLQFESAQGDSICDVTLNNWDGLRNSAFLAALGHYTSSFALLGRVVKHWARRCGVVDRRRGRLSTFGIMLMLARALQQRGALLPPSSVAAICADLNAASEEDLMKPPLELLTSRSSAAVVEADDNIGQLLLHFFETYGQRPNSYDVDLVGGGDVSSGATVAGVRCPLTGRDIEAQLARRHWRRLIFPGFARTLALLSKARGRRGETAAAKALDLEAIFDACADDAPALAMPLEPSEKSLVASTPAGATPAESLATTSSTCGRDQADPSAPATTCKAIVTA
eukprot:CAMPEP_0117513562 /NCGR_PEP_ID=MMETSP0784-20121206/29617_1 /TAXON_ID=39447 /ORGANISM="" /LENGTH=506 /DNA_ID=CAMNT_0005309329 /DNA_START=1 /DNA_END=1517 /DNA_ORIENTATION=+